MILDICSDPDVLITLSIIKTIITIIMIVVPIILLFSLIFKAVSAATQGKEDALAELKKKAVPNIVTAVLIFIVPFGINIILSILPDFTGYSSCLTNATPEGIEASVETKLDKLIARIEETLSLDDYNTALHYLEKLKDEEKNAKYQAILDELYKKIEASWRLKIADISIEDTVVTVTLKGKKLLAEYYFSSIEKEPEPDAYDWVEEHNIQFKTVKFPGTYYVYVKDTEGNITGGDKVEVPEAFNVVLMHKHLKLMPVTISTYLNKHGSSLDEFNIKMSSYNKKHGYRTRESVVTGAMAFIGEIQSWGYYLPYKGVNSGGNSTIAKDAWGVHENWGGGDMTFLACNPFVVWTFKQAGLNIYGDRPKIKNRLTPNPRLNSQGETEYEIVIKPPEYDNNVHIYYYFVGALASTNSYGDNIKDRRKGRPGDILQNGAQSGHEMLIVDKYDDDMDGKSDGYIVLQSRDIGACYEKIPFGHTTLYDMTNVYENTARYSEYLYGWHAYYIPESDYPRWMR